MKTILTHAQTLVYTLLNLMPTAHQGDSLQAVLGLFLQADGRPLPAYSTIKSPSALSRFFNEYDWPTRAVIRQVRQEMLQQLLRYQPKGRRPWLQVIIDLTTLEKCGKFTAFKHLIHVLHGKRGLHLVVLYLVVGPFRFPWGFRVWRGKNSQTPVQLALRLIDSLPASLTQAFRVMILVDTAFGSVPCLKGVRKRRYAAIVGVRCDGHQLLSAIYDEKTAKPLRQLPCVEILRRVWVQQYYQEAGVVQWRTTDNLPPNKQLIFSPYDPEARNRTKREMNWTGYTVHLTETCDSDKPHLITHVETTPATTGDVEMTGVIHQALADQDLLPGQHLVDTAYVDAQHLLSSQVDYDLDLVGPVPSDTRKASPSWSRFWSVLFSN